MRAPLDCSPPVSSVHGILQARIPEWVVIPFSRGGCLTQGSKRGHLHGRQILHQLSHPGKAHSLKVHTLMSKPSLRKSAGGNQGLKNKTFMALSWKFPDQHLFRSSGSCILVPKTCLPASQPILKTGRRSSRWLLKKQPYIKESKRPLIGETVFFFFFFKPHPVTFLLKGHRTQGTRISTSILRGERKLRQQTGRLGVEGGRPGRPVFFFFVGFYPNYLLGHRAGRYASVGCGALHPSGALTKSPRP